MADNDPAVSVCFAVRIDENTLGTFNSCEGLGVEVVLETARGGRQQRPWSGSCRPG